MIDATSTPNFLELYEALGIERPEFVTLPPILGESGQKKLGKRDGAKDILDYRKDGYLPEAMLNFLVMMGWNPGSGDNREILSLNEILESFKIEHIQKGGAQFNEDKLDWMNKEHIKKLSPEEIKKNIFTQLPVEYHNAKLVPIIAERIIKWSDVKEMADKGELEFFVKAPTISDKTKLNYKNTALEKTKENLNLAISALEALDEKDFSMDLIKTALMQVADKLESRGEILHPVRYALSGMDKSPDPFIIASILGKNETIRRLQNAI